MEHTSRRKDHPHHECEIFKGRGKQETDESCWKWNNCTKNPDHTKFHSARNVKVKDLPKVQNVKDREWLRSCIDLTVRLRVNYTSAERPDNDEFSQVRGSDQLRAGTGFIDYVYRPEINKPCPSVECYGEIKKKNWRFDVVTAPHVVYNTEEAELTMVDLFLDDESCERDGRMKTVWGVNVLRCDPARDVCYMECVTCDEDLGERIGSARRCFDGRTNYLDLLDLGLLPSCDRVCHLGMIVSHPHGQPKKITCGEHEIGEGEDFRVHYTVPTCPGSRGAPVFRLRDSKRAHFANLVILFFSPPVHSGSYNNVSSQHEDQLNYGSWFM